VASDPGGNNGQVSYTLDNVGNRLQRNSTLPPITATGLLNYDSNDRVSTDSYDANGNTIVNSGQTNVYDFENRLVQRGGVKIVYDGDGNRVKETVAGVTTTYLVSDQNPTGYAQVLDEMQNGAVTRTYSYGLELINEHQNLSGTLTTSFYGYDGHGSVRFLTDSTGAITDTYDYDAFGNPISSTGTTPNNYLFAGEQFDLALGIYYNRARYYDQRQGRFWTMDTNEGENREPISLHKYIYAGADPINRVDPSGKDFDLASFSVANSIATTLNAAEANVGFSVINGVGSCAAANSQQQFCDSTKNTLIDLLKNAAFSILFIAGVAVAGKLLGAAQQSLSLRFSQETASPAFSTAEGALFPGETIGSLASKIRLQEIPISQVPVRIVIRGNTALIFDTRSSLALMRAGVPQEAWKFINVTGDAFFEGEMTKRLLSNGLSEEGAEFF